jgi:hypothetical protein
LAQSFAVQWCNRLWSTPFAHPDPVHNRPTQEEFASFPSELQRGGSLQAKSR